MILRCGRAFPTCARLGGSASVDPIRDIRVIRGEVAVAVLDAVDSDTTLTDPLDFYTKVLGFVKKTDIDLGGGARWLTVVSRAAPDGVELLLEPDSHPAARAFKKAIHADGIPATSFEVDDIHPEYERLSKLGVAFRGTPKRAGSTTIATFDDGCGNLIQLHQVG
jgi:hypothetical protein